MKAFPEELSIVMEEHIKNLIQRAQRGDIEAFGKLVERFQDAVFGASWAAVRHFHDAEDIAQEVFVQAYQELPQLREPEKFPGWLRRITMGTCSRFRRSRRELNQELSIAEDVPTDLPGPDIVTERQALKARILEEMASLSEKNRLVTTLYFISGYSQQEISDFLEVPVSTVKSRLHESRKQLQRGLIEMAKEILHENKPGREFVQQLKKKLNGQIVALADGRVQVSYDFTSNQELRDLNICASRKGDPQATDTGLAFGRIEPEETELQFERDLRLGLVLDPDPQWPLDIEFDVTLGTSEPWSMFAWVLTTREGYAEGIPWFWGILSDLCEEWRRDNRTFREGHLRADFMKRYWYREDEKWAWFHRWAAEYQDVPLAEVYHTQVTRQDRRLKWDVNGQTLGETRLTDDETNLTERLAFANNGKGDGAVMRNLIIRARLLDVDHSWATASAEGGNPQRLR